MKILVFLLPLMLSATVYGQGKKITISGDPTDSAIIKTKLRLEAKGFQVDVKRKESNENPLLTMGDQAFRQRHKGQPLPPFTLRDVNGKRISSESLKGKRVHINFWSTTCAPCIQEFPELNELKRKYTDNGWIFLAFAPEESKKVKSVIAKNSLNYTVIPDAKVYYELLGIGGYPKNFFIGSTGAIVEVTDGTKFIQDPKTGGMKPDNFRFYDQIMSTIK